MIHLKFWNLKSQIRYDESGEGVGAKDPLEGMKAQKGEVTKRLEEMKQAESQYKDAISGLKNEIASIQGKSLPEATKAKIQIEGDIKNRNAQLSKLKEALLVLKMDERNATDSNASSAYRQQIAQVEQSIENLNEENKARIKELENVNKQVDNMKQAIAARQQQIQQYQQALVNIQGQIAMANAQKKGLEVQLKYMAGAVLKQREISKSTKKQVDAVHAEQGAVAG
jgi:chromosome segregation ATPase